MGAPRYRADPATAFVVVTLDGLTALYHRPSGMTHILAAPAPELLTLLAEAPADVTELTVRLGEQFELQQPEALQARLDELEAAGLVSRA